MIKIADKFKSFFPSHGYGSIYLAIIPFFVASSANFPAFADHYPESQCC